jgi:hypothetical protein
MRLVWRFLFIDLAVDGTGWEKGREGLFERRSCLFESS